MIREEKDLLVKDLCARLPYKPIVQITDCGIWNLRGIDHDDSAELRDRVIVWKGKYYPSSQNSFPIINCKPCLFPLESITDEMIEELNANGFFKYHNTIANVSHLESKNGISKEIYTYLDIECISFLIEYFHSHHIDYKGLIEKGLAIDATNLNIY